MLMIGDKSQLVVIHKGRPHEGRGVSQNADTSGHEEKRASVQATPAFTQHAGQDDSVITLVCLQALHPIYSSWN